METPFSYSVAQKSGHVPTDMVYSSCTEATSDWLLKSIVETMCYESVMGRQISD